MTLQHLSIQTKTPNNPSAGAGLTLTNDDDLAWDLLTLRLLYTADANVATRRPFIEIQAGGSTMVRHQGSLAITASNSSTLNYSRGLGNTHSNLDHVTSLPIPCLIHPGWLLILTASSIQAGDQLSDIAITYQLNDLRQPTPFSPNLD